MIAYVDSSVLARAYLQDEPGHLDAVAVLESSDLGLITGTWTRIEVSGAIVRAARGGRVDRDGLLQLLDEDLSDNGRITVVQADQVAVEAKALSLVREHGIRAMDAWHVAVALLTLPSLLEAGEQGGFISRDAAQSSVAGSLGLVTDFPTKGGQDNAAGKGSESAPS